MADAFQPKFVDLVRNYSDTVGTDDFVLGPAVNGFTSFADACQAGDAFYYSASNIEFPAETEVGRGTLQADGTVSRDPLGGTRTNFSAGTKSIALVAASEWFAQAQALIGSATAIGQSLLAAATPDDARAALELSGGFNVKWFGAKGDANSDLSEGSDDTAAIQAALDHVNSIGGGKVFFPEGSYKVSSYLTVYPFTTLVGTGRRTSRIVGTHAGGGGSTPAESVRNGSILYSECPINTTTAAHIAIERLWIDNVSGANEGAGFYQQSGDTILVRECELTGCKWGIILDQSEDVVIDCCEPSSFYDGGAGIWIVNGPDLNPDALGTFTNVVTIRDCHLNVMSGSYGIVDDGGSAHLIRGGDFNGGINAIRAAGVAGLGIEGIYAESQWSEIISLSNDTLAGRGVGGSQVVITGGEFSPSAGNATIKGSGAPGTVTIIGGSFSGSATPLQGSGAFYGIAAISPGLAGYPSVPFCDGSAVGVHFEPVHIRAGPDGKVGVLNLNGVSGGITLTPAASAGLIETFNSGGARQGYGFFLNGTRLQFGAEGVATSFQFLAPLSCTGSITSTGGGVGYAAGAGGTVAQATSKSSGVTLNKLSGQITMTADTIAPGATVSFKLTNSQVAAGDVLILNHVSGGTTGAYALNAHGAAAGSVTIDVTNVSSGSLAEAIVVRFAVIKAVTA
jgi:hypothetical protein